MPAYPDWRQEAERLTAAGEAMLSNKETHGAHLNRIVEAGTLMIRALSALREAIGDDDKELAERQGARAAAPAKSPLGRSPVRIG